MAGILTLWRKKSINQSIIGLTYNSCVITCRSLEILPGLDVSMKQFNVE